MISLIAMIELISLRSSKLRTPKVRINYFQNPSANLAISGSLSSAETFLEYSKKMTKIASALKQLVPLSEVDSATEIFARFTTLKLSEFNVGYHITSRTLGLVLFSE